MMAALAHHTLLAASLPRDWPEAIDSDALESGARLAEREGLGRAAFLVRIAALTETLEAEARAAFWLGAVIAEDVGHLARHPILAAGAPLWVGGREPQRSIYARWLGERHRGPVFALDDVVAEHASAVGSLAVASRFLELRTDDPGFAAFTG